MKFRISSTISDLREGGFIEPPLGCTLMSTLRDMPSTAPLLGVPLTLPPVDTTSLRLIILSRTTSMSAFLFDIETEHPLLKLSLVREEVSATNFIRDGQ